METIAERLVKARIDAGFESAADAALALGIAYPTYAGHENGARGIKNELAVRYAKKFKVSLEWLVTGRAQAVGRKQSGDVPQFNIHAGMGNGGLLSVETDQSGLAVNPEDSDGFWTFPDSVKAGWRQMPRSYALPVTGDSMEPTLPNGSYVFVDTTHTIPSPPDIYAIDYGDGLMVKRVELIPQSDGVRIVSDNARYRDYELRREDVRVYGRVVAWFQWRG